MAAVFTDIRERRIHNRMVCLGIGTGLLFQFWELGGKGLLIGIFTLSIPVILFFLLFLMRALGAGDIKLFSMIGSIWNIEFLLWCMALSFVVGAILSLGKMIYNKNLVSRLSYFQQYVQQAIQERTLSVYDRPSTKKQNFIHFSMAIFVGCILTMIL